MKTATRQTSYDDAGDAGAGVRRGRFHKGFPKTLLALLLGLPTLLPAQVWSWNSFDFVMVERGGTEVTLHTRVRIRGDEWQEARIGAVVSQALTPRVKGIAGYYYGREEDFPAWRGFHRVFGGAEFRVLSRGPWRLQSRALLERLMPRQEPDTFRFRERLKLATNWRVGPALSGEWFLDGDGYAYGRYSAGVRWRMAGWSVLEAGYLFDARRPRIGRDRHVIVTQWTIRPWD